MTIPALMFDSDTLPAELRLAGFRAGAADFRVEPVGDAADFTARWRLLTLGEINVIRAEVTPLSYERDAAMIAADGRDRVAIHYYVRGGATGVLDGVAVHVGAGEALVWDLTRPLSIRSTGPSELVILTFPRHLLGEAVGGDNYAARLAAGAALTVAVDAARTVLDGADALPPDGAPFLARALRDLFAAAMLPAQRRGAPATIGRSRMRAICDVVDADPAAPHDARTIAARLGCDVASVLAAAAPAGSVAAVVEQRRLLAAYRLLDDPRHVGSVATIAWSVGFRDTSRFSRRFAEVFDVTPSSFRRTHVATLPAWAGAYPVERLYESLLEPR